MPLSPLPRHTSRLTRPILSRSLPLLKLSNHAGSRKGYKAQLRRFLAEICILISLRNLAFKKLWLTMGLKSSTLLQEEDIEELQNETGCKLKVFCENLRLSCRLKLHCLTQLWTLYLNFFTVSPDQIKRLYSRFTSLDKSTKGTLR